MDKKICIKGIGGALKNYRKSFGKEKEPWYANRIGDVFTVDTEFEKSYYVKEYPGSVIKEDAEIIE